MEDLIIEEYRKKLEITHEFYRQLIRKLALGGELTKEESTLVLEILGVNTKK